MRPPRSLLVPAGVLLVSAACPAFLHAQAFQNVTVRFTAPGGTRVLEVRGEADLPDEGVVTVRVMGLWPAPAGELTFEGMPPYHVPVAGKRFEEAIPLPEDFPPGRYALTIEFDVYVQPAAIAMKMARRRPPPPLHVEGYAGTTSEALKHMQALHARLTDWAAGFEQRLAELRTYATARQRSDRDEARMKAASDLLAAAIREDGEERKPPFPAVRTEFLGMADDLLVLVPSPMVDEDGRPLAVDDAGTPADPQAIFADDRLEKGAEALAGRLNRARTLIRRDHANALLGEMERAGRMLAAAWREAATAGGDPRGWGDAVRQAREGIARLKEVSEAPEMAAAGDLGWDGFLSRLDRLVTGAEASPPAAGGAADPPEDVVRGVEELIKALQAARARLAS